MSPLSLSSVSGLRRYAVAAGSVTLAMFMLLVPGAPVSAQDASNVRPPAGAVTNAPPARPDTAPQKGGNYDIELWQKLRHGAQGTVSIPDEKAGTLVQASGEEWRMLRRNELPQWGGYAMAAMLALLAVFYLVRGRIRVGKGPAGTTITRFTDTERMAHWLMAVSFIIQALTGLNALYGRDVLMPVIGKEAFASLSMGAKWLHSYVAFAFMIGLVMSFAMWVKHNFPNRHDVVWLIKAGGMLSKDSHPPAKKFNAGQKTLFWIIMLGGVSLSLSGLSLLLPFELSLFSKTFAVLNVFGLGLPTSLTPVQEMQYAVTWHSIIALGLIVVIFGHIYIGTIGMEGAFDAMGTGEVDLNWAKEHHGLWVEEELQRDRVAPRGSGARMQPAE